MAAPALAFALQVLFADPNGATDGIYTGLGRDPLPVRVIRTSVTDRVAGSLGTFGAVAEADTAELQVAEVPDKPLKGATVEYDGRLRRVEKAQPAKNGLTWLLTLAAA